MKLSTEVYLQITQIYSLPVKNDMSGWRAEPTTIRQKQIMNNAGLCFKNVRYKGQAYILIHSLNNRKKSGLATPKKMAILYKNGVSIAKLRNMSERAADMRLKKLGL